MVGYMIYIYMYLSFMSIMTIMIVIIISNLLDNPIYFPMGFASTVGYMSTISIPCFPVVAFKTSVYMIYSIKSS